MFQVDAFTGRLFAGNPAAVCPLERWFEDETLQAVAAENNLSETAFFVATDSGYQLRWFTPTTEVELCGHATLASAFVIWNYLGDEQPCLRFETRSGPLTVEREGDLVAMLFPARAARPVEAPARLADALSRLPAQVWFAGRPEGAGNYMAVYEQEEEVRALKPDFHLLSQWPPAGFIATAPGRQVDFVSRYFAPAFGVPEDPVTGSTHCTLVPYWAERLGKDDLHARQLSARGGELFCRQRGEKVSIAGRAVCYLRGTARIS